MEIVAASEEPSAMSHLRPDGLVHQNFRDSEAAAREALELHHRLPMIRPPTTPPPWLRRRSARPFASSIIRGSAELRGTEHLLSEMLHRAGGSEYRVPA